MRLASRVPMKVQMRRIAPWIAFSLPVAAQQEASPPALELPSLATCRALLSSLDDAWNAGDADAYLRHFQPEQPLLHDLHGRRTHERLSGTSTLQRTTELGRPRSVGDHVVLPVRYETRCQREGVPPLREGGLLVARPEGKGLQAVLAVDLPTLDCADGDVFTCPPCNFRMGGAPGWLCVPITPERAAAFDGATFLLLGTAIALEITVEVDAALPALAVVERLAAELRRRIDGSSAAAAEPWQPPGVPADVPGFGAARATVDLPDGERVVLLAGVLGRLRHLLLLRGSRALLQSRAQQVDELLATYQLCTTDRAIEAWASGAMAAHTGGVLGSDGTYRNERHGVAATGPKGWRGTERCAGARFLVQWTAPDAHGRMWLCGLAPPPGFERWSAALADRSLADQLQRAGLKPTADDSGWKALADGGGHERRLTAAPADQGAPLRRFRLLLRDDLLVIANVSTPDAGCADAVAAALESVQLRR